MPITSSYRTRLNGALMRYQEAHFNRKSRKFKINKTRQKDLANLKDLINNLTHRSDYALTCQLTRYIEAMKTGVHIGRFYLWKTKKSFLKTCIYQSIDQYVDDKQIRIDSLQTHIATLLRESQQQSRVIEQLKTELEEAQVELSELCVHLLHHETESSNLTQSTQVPGIRLTMGS